MLVDDELIAPQRPEAEEGPLAADSEDDACPGGYGIGQLRDHLFRLQAKVELNDADIELGVHASECPVCQERVQELNLLEDALRNKIDFQNLVPLMDAVMVRDAQRDPVGQSAVELTQIRVARKLTGEITAAQRKSIVSLNAEYEKAFRSKQGLQSLKEKCREDFERLPPAEKQTADECMIDVVGQYNTRRQSERPNRIRVPLPSGPKGLLGLLGFLLRLILISKPSDRRVFDLEGKVADPNAVQVDMDQLTAA